MKVRSSQGSRLKAQKQSINRLDRQMSSSNRYKESDLESEEQNITKRFSSEYISLARKFKIKMVGSSQARELSTHNFKPEKIRVKTQFSKSKMRYGHNPTDIVELRPFSEFVANSKNSHRSTLRGNKLAMFSLNRNTVYNDGFVRLKTETEKDHLLGEQMRLKVEGGVEPLVHLGMHCRKLWAVKQSLGKECLNSLEVIRQIKTYILDNERHSISKLNQAVDQDEGPQVKELILLERAALLAVVFNIASSHFYELLDESNRVVEIVLGFWYQVLNTTYQQNLYRLEIQQSSPVKAVLEQLCDAKLLTKSNIKLLLDTVTLKMDVLFKYCRPLLVQVKHLLTMSHQISISRAFYELLTLFASHLTHFEAKFKINLDNIAFFATCPSPYLLKPPLKPYSLVLELSQALLILRNDPKQSKEVKSRQQKSDLLLRPGLGQFLHTLSKFYQIIVFTTSTESQATKALQQLGAVDHCLFRQHAVRLRNGLVKDLSRLGRDLNRVVIIDHSSAHFRNNKENGIRIQAWKGDPADNELPSLQEHLLKLANSSPTDVRPLIAQYKQNHLQSTRRARSLESEKGPGCEKGQKEEGRRENPIEEMGKDREEKV